MMILAIDLGKTKSVACIYDVERSAATFRKIPTAGEAIGRLLTQVGANRVVIEICPIAGWIGDLVLSTGSGKRDRSNIRDFAT